MRNDQLELATIPVADLAPSTREEIVQLCSDALETDCGSLFGYLFDSTHVLATQAGRLIGHACWWSRLLVPDGLAPLRTAWVDAVVVDPAQQRQGIGTAVMRRLADLTEDFELRALGTERMVFFARLGWEPWQGPVSGVLHDPADTLMILRAATAPRMDTAAPISAKR